MEGVSLTHQILESFHAGKIIRDNYEAINSLDFSNDSTQLITASNDDSMVIYNIQGGSKERLLFNPVYGVENIKFTHDPSTFISSNRKGKEHVILHWNSYDNKAIYIFRGHKDKILSLEMNPSSDNFISYSANHELLIWDLREPSWIGQYDAYNSTGSGACAYDPSGSIIAIAHPIGHARNRNEVSLIDPRNLKECYMTWEIASPVIQQIQFSNDGRFFMGYTEDSSVMILDAFQGSKVSEIRGGGNGRSMACFSGDSQYIAVGNEINNSVVIADCLKGEIVKELHGQPRVPGVVAWNAEYALIVSACQNLLMWVPDYSSN